jgi:hypothetical protein
MTSQGRITGYLISGLPIILALFLLTIQPDFMNPLFESRLCGWPGSGSGPHRNRHGNHPENREH